MQNLKILPYKMGSKSAKLLASHFNVKRIYAHGKFKPNRSHAILNWGCNNSSILNDECNILNKPENIVLASNKITALQAFATNNVPHIEFVLTREEALQWIKDGNVVYCRTLTRGSEGNGIVIATKEEELVTARLYTKYFKNLYEYRIHVFNGEVIDRTQKKRMSSERLQNNQIEEEDTSKYVRNHMKGWVFTRKDMFIPEGIDKVAIDAVNALGLDFGAVDIAYNKYYNQLKVFEVNTAIGFSLPSSTHFSYCKAISKYLGIELTANEYNTKYNSNIILS
jgi:hypothetical protein